MNPSTNELETDDDFIWPYDEGMKIFITLTVLSAILVPAVGYCCYSAAKDRDPKWMTSGILEPSLRCCRHDKNDRAYCGVPGGILIICGLATLAAWCSQAHTIQAHEYHGPMLVTNIEPTGIRQSSKYSYEYDCRQESYKCGDRTCRRETCSTGYYESMLAYMHVAWGGPWGCNEHQYKSCASKEEIGGDCHVKVCGVQTHDGARCSDADRDAARAAVVQCVEDVMLQGADAMPHLPVDFDVNVSPDDGAANLFYAKMYGDCDVCSAMVSVPTGAAKRNRVAGFVCLWVGLGLFGLFVVKNGCLGMCCGWEGEVPYPVWMEPPAKWERYIRPQKFNPNGNRMQFIAREQGGAGGAMEREVELKIGGIA
eukprot:CAMPEP_0182460126 /NCGR_PEP_ID=MMETSP1319-20130603/5080_1 /TAXON_ID=172717 /ORGANISM="Bolidomonas pacifica, Strain RCC208" /LENGTH=367 /DNA_ID=CAMNT_0024659177 /DNA_START=17 /DNA_END=1120 /DNA_ORIENTATION=-